MSIKAFGILLKVAAALIVISLGGSLWYYTIGRKPTLMLSAPIPAGNSSPTAHLIGAGQTLLVNGTKATLYDISTGQPKWTASVSGTTAPAKPPAPPQATPPAKLAAAPTPAKSKAAPARAPAATPIGEKADLLIPKRVERRFANLQTWANKLSAKRATLKTKIQIEAFNEEAAKYHAELVSARAEAATIAGPQGAATPSAVAQLEPMAKLDAERIPVEHWETEDGREKTSVFSDEKTVWVAHGKHLTALDRADGRTTKDIPLEGEFEKVLHGPGCRYLVASSGGRQQITKICAVTEPAKSMPAGSGPAEARLSGGGYGGPSTPNVQSERTEFSAFGGELLEVDIHLIEKKITEHQVVSSDSPSEMEEADKKTKGGWGNDAAIFSKALAKDAAREANGGKERVDESTYEITLQRPFSTPAVAKTSLRVQGRPDVFSTADLDLIAAGNTLMAFDRNNQKLWETKLAQPAAVPTGFGMEDEDAGSDSVATPSQPCLEKGEFLYFFDQGFLSAFETKTGKPVWRLPSIGIRKAQLDGGNVYITSANGNPDSLKYGGAGNDSLPVILKVDAKDGKILWRLEKYQDCFVSDGNLYATRETRNSEDAVNQVFDPGKAPECRFKLYKLNASNGEPQWEWFQIHRPLHIEANKKQVSLLFRGELQVIKSMAL